MPRVEAISPLAVRLVPHSRRKNMPSLPRLRRLGHGASNTSYRRHNARTTTAGLARVGRDWEEQVRGGVEDRTGMKTKTDGPASSEPVTNIGEGGKVFALAMGTGGNSTGTQQRHGVRYERYVISSRQIQHTDHVPRPPSHSRHIPDAKFQVISVVTQLPSMRAEVAPLPAQKRRRCASVDALRGRNRSPRQPWSVQALGLAIRRRWALYDAWFGFAAGGSTLPLAQNSSARPPRTFPSSPKDTSQWSRSPAVGALRQRES